MLVNNVNMRFLFSWVIPKLMDWKSLVLFTTKEYDPHQ